MELFRDKCLYTKEYYMRKPVTPKKEALTQPLNLTPADAKTGEPEREKVISGRVIGHEVLNGKIVGLYFSAGWCPPCQQFTSLLGRLYEELKNRSANFEVVFLSFDKNADDMEIYFRSKHKDWYALPFDDPLKEALKLKYNITAVPKLIIVHRNGEVITAKGRKEVKDKGVVCFRNWQQAAGVIESKLSQSSQASAAGVDKKQNAAEENGEKKKDVE